MQKRNFLKIEPRHRAGGDGRTARNYLDFVVDDEPLSAKFDGDFVSCLGWLFPEENSRAVHRLLLEAPADFPNERRSLYVCPECADLGCGAVSLIIEKIGGEVIWRMFGYQNNYEDVVVMEGFSAIGPFVFGKAEYEAVIRSAL